MLGLVSGLILLSFSDAPAEISPLPPLVPVDGGQQILANGHAEPTRAEDAETSASDPKNSHQAQIANRLDHNSFLSVGLDAALDLPAAGSWPMASTRFDLRYRIPVFLSATTEFGLRSGYSLRGFSASVYDSTLGLDSQAILALHSVPVLATLTLSYCNAAPLLFGEPARASLYGGLGAQIIFGNAQAFGRNVQVMSVLPAYLVGASLAIQPSPALSYGLFAEWESGRAGLQDIPGLSENTSALRLGVSLQFAYEMHTGENHE